jgi:hypothetical protein
MTTRSLIEVGTPDRFSKTKVAGLFAAVRFELSK